MFVKNHMIPASKIVFTNENASLRTALDIMEQHGHDALPVVDSSNKLVGIISKQHIYKVFFMQDTDKQAFVNVTQVKELMKTNFKTVWADDLLEAAIKQMTNMRMQFIVVFNQQSQCIGILTRRILLEAMANALGMDKKGVRIEVVLNDMHGRLASLTKVLAKSDLNIRSIIMIDPHLMDLQKVIMRLDSRDEKSVVTLIENAGFKVLTSVLE